MNDLRFKAEIVGSWDEEIYYREEHSGRFSDVFAEAEDWFADKLIKRQKLDVENDYLNRPHDYDSSEDCYCSIYIYAPNGKQLKRIWFEAGSSYFEVEADDDQLLFWQYTAGIFNGTDYAV